MLAVNNNTNYNTYFNGNYSGRVSHLSKEARELVVMGTDVIKEAGDILKNFQNINAGKYIISNVEQPSRIIPRLSAEVDKGFATMTPYSDGFALQVKKGGSVDLISVWGSGDIVEFESTLFKLKPDEFKDLEAAPLDRVNYLLKKYLPIFTNREKV